MRRINLCTLFGLGRVLLLGALVTVSVGCGAPSTPAPAPPPSTPTAKETPRPTQTVTPAPSAEKFSVALFPNIGYLPFFVALEKGLFKEDGLALEKDPLPMSGNISVAALASGVVDFNGLGGSTMRAAAGGFPAKVVMFIYNAMLFSLVARPEVSSVEGLKGKAIGVSRIGDTTEYAARIALRKFGLVPDKDVSIRAVGTGVFTTRFAAMKAGVVDALMANPDEAAMVAKEGFRILVDLGDSVPTPFSGFAVMDQKLKQNPNQVKKFIKAMVKGIIYTLDRPEEVSQVALKRLSLDEDVAREAVRLASKALSRTDPGGATEEGVKLVIEMEIKDALGLKVDVPASKIIDFTLLREAQKELKLR